MRSHPIFLTFCYLWNVATASYLGEWCPVACETTLGYATFNDTDVWLSRKVRSCRSNLHVTSLYLCFDEYCEDDGSKEEWIDEQSSWCDVHAGTTLPDYQTVVDCWKSEAKKNVTRLSADAAMKWPVLSHFVIPDAGFFERAFTTTSTALWEYNLHLVYGWYMYYFWIIVVALGVCTRLISLIQVVCSHDRKHIATREYHIRTARKVHHVLSLPKAWLKRYLFVPAAFGDRCSRPYGWCTIPPRIQSLTIFFFVILNIILCSCSYRLTDGNLYWPQKSVQLLRYVSDRTGIISLANFPLVWLFGMRNDLLMWITGWGFGTYNAFHRWVARVATVQAVVHSLGYTLMILESGDWSHFLKYCTKHYFWNGELATLAMCALLGFSFYGIRRAHYEVFLITHIVLSIAALWSMYYHVEIFTNGDWNIFIWPCVGIWISDRVLRLARIIAFNRNPFNTKATVSYDSNCNLVRMDVDGSVNMLAPKPGTYYYIHVLDDLLYAHQSHPFTLAYVSSNTEPSTESPLPPIMPKLLTQRSSSTLSTESNESDALLESAKSKASSNLVFLIRPYNGFTSRLKEHSQLHPKDMRVLIEGPYGHTVSLQTFVNVLFIVGGTGVAVPLSHLSHLLSTTTTISSIKIVWAVREHAFLASILRKFNGLLGDERVEMEVHITRDDEAKDEVLGEDLKSVRIMAHRPDVPTVVAEAAQDAGQTSLAIVACGPALMADQARKATATMLGRGYHGVEYYEESFKW